MEISRSVQKLIISLSFLALLLLAFPSASPGHQIRVLEVFDGDTFRADCGGTEIKVRLAGIDAPEIGENRAISHQPYSEEAKSHLEGLILNKVVDIECYGLGDGDIYLVSVSLGDRKINLEMVVAGLAEVDSRGLGEEFKLKSYYDAERTARVGQAGMWALGDRYVSPKLWRERERGKTGAALLFYGIFGKKAK